MLESATGQVRALVYTVICFQCLIQLMAGSPYQRYLKLFSYLLIVSLSVNTILLVGNQFMQNIKQVDSLYEIWVEQWTELEEVLE